MLSFIKQNEFQHQIIKISNYSYFLMLVKVWKVNKLCLVWKKLGLFVFHRGFGFLRARKRSITPPLFFLYYQIFTWIRKTWSRNFLHFNYSYSEHEWAALWAPLSISWARGERHTFFKSWAQKERRSLYFTKSAKRARKNFSRK